MDTTSYLLGKKAGGGGDTPTGTIDITSNGTYNVSSYASADVSVQPDLESKSVEITTNTTTTITPTSGKDGLSSVEVITNIPQPSGTINITQNGTVDVSSYASADVNVASQKYAPKYHIQFSTGSGYDQAIDLSDEVNNLDTSNMTSFYNMFTGFWYLTLATADFSNWDTSNITVMQNMFSSSIRYTTVSLDFSNWNTSNVYNLNGMFQDAYGLTGVNFSGWNTSKVSSFSNMFSGCATLTTLDLSSFTSKTDGTNVNTSTMFSGCKNLMHLDMRNFDFTKITTSTNMFGNNSATYVPANCEIIVADATQKAWLNSNFSRMTNVKTVAEL